jgi:membrane associated rhomboid family serine protease
MTLQRFADIAEPRRGFADLPPLRVRTTPVVQGLGAQIPVLTTGLLLLLLLIFAAELFFSVDATPGFDLSGQTLTAVGALDALLALHQGEWWRIATAPFLHANLAHIVGNGLVLLFVGATL